MTGRAVHRAEPRWTALAGLGPALLFVVLALPVLDESSATYDETEHVPAGYTYVTRGDYRLGPEHPPLVKTLMALALLGQSPTISPSAERAFGAARHDIDAHWVFGDRFLFKDNAPGPLLWRARAVIVALGALLILVVFAWTRAAFGLASALVAATAAALDPNLLAHGSLATTDVGFTLCFAAALYGARRAFLRLTIPAILGTGVAIAAAFASKHSAVLLVPCLALLGVLRLASSAPWPGGAAPRGDDGADETDTPAGRATAAFAPGSHADDAGTGAAGRYRPNVERSGPGRRTVRVVALLVLWGLTAWGGLWAAYGFRYAAVSDGTASLPIATWTGRIREIGLTRQHLLAGTPLPPPGVLEREAAARAPGVTERVIVAAHEHRLVPEGYAFGLAFATAMAQVRRAFLLGEISLTGFTSYFPLAFVMKTPLGTLALLALALALAVRALVRWNAPDAVASRTEIATIVAPPLIVMGAAMSASLNIGYRHILPMLPFVYVLAGLVPAALVDLVGRRATALVCTAAVLVLAVETVNARPYFLPFFNAAAGGARGGLRLLSDSNLDWGQGLPALRRWMRDQQVERINLAYFGTADPAAYGIAFVPLPGSYRLAVPGAGGIGHAPRAPELPGWVAISATHLQGTYLLPSEHRFYDPLRRRQPDAIVADSIYVYWVERWEDR